jgi:histidine triad (HIT) family protein
METPSHRPADYRCPFCRVVAGENLPGNGTRQSDIVWRDEHVMAFICSAWWPENAGHVLVVPNVHAEHIYAIPDADLAAVQLAGKQVALALRAVYGCDGTSFRQHNEPGANQDVWHYHLHVFPRYRGDRLYERTAERRTVTPEERAPYAARLRDDFARGGERHSDAANADQEQ